LNIEAIFFDHSRGSKAYNLPICAGDLRVSTASGSERGFRKGLIDGALLATARGTDPSSKVYFQRSRGEQIEHVSLDPATGKLEVAKGESF
jgi:hypothetical protein